MSAPAVSVIICAYTEERWPTLTAAVESALDGAHEVLLVIDHDAALLRRARERWAGGGVRVLPNAGARGLSHARNTGLGVASGDIVAFLDDDAVAHDGWLAALTAPFADPAVVATGGVARPVWPAQRPAAIPHELDWVVGCTFRGQPRGADVRNVMGCSMAFRTDALRAIGGFHTGLGRAGGLPMGVEETDACIRARRRDPAARIAFVEGAVVSHRVPAARTSLRYVLTRSWAEGISKATMSQRLGADESLSSERRYVSRVLPTAVVRELGHGNVLGAVAIVASVAAAAAAFARTALAGTSLPRLRRTRGEVSA